jgi:beta-glucosidase
MAFFVLAFLCGCARAQIAPPTHTTSCLGEFSYCPLTGACTVTDCTLCTRGEYRCPLSTVCVSDARAYSKPGACPSLNGTHLDWTLTDDERLDLLVAASSLADQISQLTARAPALPALGIPAYNWLNDDVHGLASGFGTMFPSGNALGATFNRTALRAVAHAIAREARGSHNAFTHSGNRGMTGGVYDFNGLGLTMYSPNINLVRSPLWGRAQEVYGEDPLLTAELAKAYVGGAQALSADPRPGGSGRMLAGACCKHLAAYVPIHSLACALARSLPHLTTCPFPPLFPPYC